MQGNAFGTSANLMNPMGALPNLGGMPAMGTNMGPTQGPNMFPNAAFNVPARNAPKGQNIVVYIGNLPKKVRSR